LSEIIINAGLNYKIKTAKLLIVILLKLMISYKIIGFVVKGCKLKKDENIELSLVLLP